MLISRSLTSALLLQRAKWCAPVLAISSIWSRKMATGDENVHQKIADVMLKSVASDEDVPVSSLWKDKACVLFFMRRFG